MIAHLYRQAGALGVATHWDKVGGYRHGFEYLGQGTFVAGHVSSITGRWIEPRSMGPVAVSKDIFDSEPLSV